MKMTAVLPMVWRTLSVGLLLVSFVAVPVQAEPAGSPSDSEKQLPLEELRLFTEVFQRIKSAYVEPVSDAKLLEDALRGMLAGLDPHSTYLVEDEFANLQEHTSGEFGGLGIEVGMEDGFIRVIAPIDDTPAQRAGVKAGDLITKLGDQAVQGMDLNDAISLMRGEPGTSLLLTIIRQGEEKPLEIEVERAVIQVASVKSRLLDNDYAYLRITQFQVDTGKELVRQLEKMQLDVELKGLILDLRNNPGGVLQAAVEVSDAFLHEGMIVYTEGRLEEAKHEFHATKRTAIGDIPVVVLINGGSASASEIVAGALQDHKRAVIMGQDTFGKGSVQTILPLSEDRALKLTTARYYTPSGRSIQAQGIVPDIQVENAEIKLREEQPEFIKERELSGHLENGSSDPQQPNNKDSQVLASKDYLLYEALGLLKALVIIQR
ncbi:S41 family peptidase [Pontibacter sp. JAM-7]|uniref:S41 family peptidase n=1 Tax=Pontibacter sp. JAM-7 TaxID=3366581 RepID=UPI003AF78DC4